MADAEEVAKDILRQMYEEAEPGLDFDKAHENPEDYPDDWYDRHFLSEDRQQEIVDEHLDGVNLSEREETAVIFTTIVDLGPTSVKSRVESLE